MNKLFSLKIILACSVVLMNAAFAQTPQIDAKQQLKNKLAALTTYQASFSQKVTDIDNTVLQQATGYIALEQPNKLYWELLEPNESVLLADGTNIWNIDPFLEQVVMYSADSTLDNNPLILLTDPDSDKWQDFVVAASNNQFSITPVLPNGGIESLVLVFKGERLIELESRDGQQQTSSLSFSDIKQNQPVPAGKFTFVLPDGYELDDQSAL